MGEKHTDIIKQAEETASLERKDVVSIAKDKELRAALRKEALTRAVDSRAKLARAIEAHRVQVGPQPTPDLELNEADHKELGQFTNEIHPEGKKAEAPAAKSETFMDRMLQETKNFGKGTVTQIKKLGTKQGWQEKLDWAMETGSWIATGAAELWHKVTGWLKDKFGSTAEKLGKTGLVTVPNFLKPDAEEIRDVEKGREAFNKGKEKPLVIARGEYASDLDFAKKITDIQFKVQVEKAGSNDADKAEWATKEQFMTKLFSKLEAAHKEAPTMRDAHNIAIILQAEAGRKAPTATPPPASKEPEKK